MGKAATLRPRLTQLAPRVNRQPWQRNDLSPKRLSGRALQTRNDRVKLRDKWTCRHCGTITTELEIDHRVPLSEGGAESDENCQSLCIPCHEAKTKRETGERNAQGVNPRG